MHKVMSRCSISSMLLFLAYWPSPAGACEWRFLCFFDFGGIQLSTRCQAIIAEAVQQWENLRDGRRGACETPRQRITAKLEVVGNAWEYDRPAANQALSERRAEAVAAALRSLGATQVYSHGVGDRSPFVPNGGRAEPQNRFAEIIFHLP